MDPGRLPDVGFTVSQLPPSLVLAVAEKVVMLELLLEILTELEAGTVLLAAKLKLREFGDAESGLGPEELTLSCTGIAKNWLSALTLMKPLSVVRFESAGLTETVS